MKYFVQTESLGLQNFGSWRAAQASFTSIYGTTLIGGDGRIIVLPPRRIARKRCFNWNLFVGLVTVLGISAASWTGVALLISHWLK